MAYQKFPDSKALNRELNSGKLERIYLFLGEEEGEKEKATNRIIKQAVRDDEYSSARFHAEYGELSSASEYIMSASMFAETRVCVILNIESIKAKSGEGAVLNYITGNIPDHNILIMTSPENKVPQVLSKNTANIKIIQFWKPFENDLKNYVINTLKKNHIEINIEAVKLLIDLTGRDVKKIDEAILKMLDSGEKSITIDIIRHLIPDTKDVSVFEFIDALFQKSRSTFYDLVKVIEAGNNELMILKLIIRQAEMIEKYLFLTNNNITSSAALQETGVSQRNTEVFLKCTKNYSLSTIKNIFPIIHKADQSLKSYGYSGNISYNPLFDLVSTMLLDKSL